MEKQTSQETLSVDLAAGPPTTIELIDSGQASLVPIEQLVPFYVKGDAITKRIKVLLDNARKSLIERRDQAQEKAGDKQQHRVFTFNGDQLTIQAKGGIVFDMEKLEALLKEKKLYDQATNLSITTSGDKFQKFLRRPVVKKELQAMHITIEAVIDMEKVDGLAKAKLLTVEEIASVTTPKETTYALIPKPAKLPHIVQGIPY